MGVVVPRGVMVPGGVVTLGVVTVGVVPPVTVGVVPPAPVDDRVGTVPAGGALPGTCLGLELPNLCLFRLWLLGLCAVGAEPPATAIRSPVLTDDDWGGEDVARASETARDDPYR